MGFFKNIGLICMMSLGSLQAADYYVATTGDDANSGAIDSPFRTIAKASSIMVAGDNCYLRGGTYREIITPANSGTAGNEITYQAYQDEEVTISTAEVVTGWTVYQGSIYSAPTAIDLGDGFNQVFVDDAMVNRARWPNTGSNLLNPTLANGSTTATTFSFDVNRDADYWVGGTAYGAFKEKWTSQGAVITASTAGGVLTIDENTKTSNWYTGSGKGYITGIFGELDSEGEWFIKDGSLYLWAPGSVDPSTLNVEIKSRSWCVDLSNKSYITVKGLQLFGGPINMNGTNNSVIDDCEVKYMSHFTRFTWGGMDAAGGIEDGHNGIWLNGDDNVIKNCVIEDTAGSGIAVYGGNNLITRNIIRNTDYSGTYSCPLSVKGSTGNNQITFNSMYNSGRDILQLYGTTNDQVMYNDLYDAGRLTHDLGITYQWGRDGNGTRIAYNWIHDNHANGPGIYHDNYCSEFITDHNVIWNCQSGVRHNRPTTKMETYNNTLFNCNNVGSNTYNQYPNYMPQYWSDAGYGNLNDYVAKNNLFLSTNPASQLKDYANYDFRLIDNSSQIDAGEEVMPYTDGFIGGAPDNGAYEFGMTNWTAGFDGVAASPILTPVVVTLDATDKSADSATLNGELSLLGTNPTEIWVYWGDNDGLNVSGDWDNAIKLADATSAPESYSHVLSSLTVGSEYFYRFYAVNVNGESWGETVSFSTGITSTISFEASTDLHIAPNGSKTTDAPTLVCGNPGGGDRRIFMKFDTSSLDESYIITKATLKLYHIEGTNDNWGQSYVYNIDSQWDSSSVTYGQTISGDGITAATNTGPFNQYVEVDVTNRFTSESHYGFSVRGEEGHTLTGRYYVSSEGVEGQRPVLEVEYINPNARVKVLNPVEDLHIFPNGAKNSDAATLQAGNPENNAGNDRRIFMNFDMDSLEVATITKATLRVYHNVTELVGLIRSIDTFLALE